MKENFYHGILLGLLSFKSSWEISSNQTPRSKLTGYQSCNAANCGVFDPRGIRQMDANASAWLIARGNKESGDGYSDIQVEIEKDELGIVIEVKYCETGNLDAGCHDALEQIEENRYTERLYDAGMKNVLKYGIACYKKHCKVTLG